MVLIMPHIRVPARGNMLSTLDHSEVVYQYLEKKLKDRITDITGLSDIMGIQISPFGVIPKRVQVNGASFWISLARRSVNGIDKHLCLLTYILVDNITVQVVRLGRGTKLAKMDVKSAYRLVPVHPQDHVLLRMQWKQTICG